MKNRIFDFLRERNISTNISSEELYIAGMENVKNNIEFYYDKTYTCESVIQELFIRGVINRCKNG